MKKELSILCGNPQSCEEIAHANPEMFVMVIHRCGMVRLGLRLGPARLDTFGKMELDSAS
jgi:hypothetical protein